MAWLQRNGTHIWGLEVLFVVLEVYIKDSSISWFIEVEIGGGRNKLLTGSMDSRQVLKDISTLSTHKGMWWIFRNNVSQHCLLGICTGEDRFVRLKCVRLAPCTVAEFQSHVNKLARP